MPPRPRDDDALRPEYDDDHDEAAERRAHRSAYPANPFALPGKGSWHWGGTRPFIDAVHAKIVVEGPDRSLAALAGDLPIRQVKEQPYADLHWLWTGAKEQDGRPVLRVNKRKEQARRVLWALYRGGVPDTRLVVKVVCDRPGCVNPRHFDLLRRGSWQQPSERRH